MIQAQLDNSTGLFASIRRLGETALAIVHNRVELAAIELQEEKSRAVGLLLWAAFLIFFGFMMMVAITLTVIFLFWEQRLIVAGGFAAFYLIGAIAAFIAMKQKLKNPPIPFAESIAQLKKDREWLESLR